MAEAADLAADTVYNAATDDNATLYPFQRKVVYAASNFWVLFSDGTNLVILRSLDGDTWTNAVGVKANSKGYTASMWYDSENICVVYASGVSNTALQYVQYTPYDNGTLSIQTAWQNAQPANVNLSYSKPSVCKDTSGYPIISYTSENATGERAYVTKANQNDGTWSSDNFNTSLSDNTDYVWYTSVVPMGSQDFMALYARDTYYLASKVYDFSTLAFLSENTTDSALEKGYAFSAVTTSDNAVHLVYEYADDDIIYTYFEPGAADWSVEEDVYVGSSATKSPVLSKTLDDNLYCFWMGDPDADHVYYKSQSQGTWDASETVFQTEVDITDNASITCAYAETTTNYIPVAWLTGVGSPYDVRLAALEREIEAAAFVDQAEDISTYSENDTGSDLLKSKYRVEWKDMPANVASNFVYTSASSWSGADYIVYPTVCLKEVTGQAGFWIMTDSLNNMTDMAGPYIRFYHSGRTWYVAGKNAAGGAITGSSTAAITSTYDYRPLYCKIESDYSAGSGNITIYTNPDRDSAGPFGSTENLTTLTWSGQDASWTADYMQLATSANAGSASESGGYVGELYINDTPIEVFPSASTANPAVVFQPDIYEDFASFPTGDMTDNWTTIEEGAENYLGGIVPDTNVNANIVVYNQITVGASDVLITHLEVYPKVAGTVKVGIYTDNGSDHPWQKVALSNTSSYTLTINTWNRLYIAPTTLTASTKYWLAYVGSAAGTVARKASGGAQREYQIVSSLPDQASPTALDGYIDGIRASYYSAAAGNSLAKVSLGTDPGTLPTNHTGTQYGIKVVTDNTNNYAAGTELSFTISTYYNNMASFWCYLDSLGDGEEAQLFAIGCGDFEQVWGVGATIVRSGATYYWRLRGNNDLSTQTTYKADVDTWYHVTVAIKNGKNDNSHSVFACLYVNGIMVDSIKEFDGGYSEFTKINKLYVGYFGGLTTTKGGTYFVSSYNVAGNLAGNGVLFGTTYFPDIARGGSSDSRLLMCVAVCDTHMDGAFDSYTDIFYSDNNGQQDTWQRITSIITTAGRRGPTTDQSNNSPMLRWSAQHSNWWYFNQRYDLDGDVHTEIWEIPSDLTSAATLRRTTDADVRLFPSRILDTNHFGDTKERILIAADNTTGGIIGVTQEYHTFLTESPWTLTKVADITSVGDERYEPFLYLEGNGNIDTDLAVLIRDHTDLSYSVSHSHFDGTATWSALDWNGNIPKSWAGLGAKTNAFLFRGKLYCQTRMSFGDYTAMQALFTANPDTLDIVSQYMYDPVGDVDHQTTGAFYWETGNGSADASDYQSSEYYMLDCALTQGIVLFSQVSTGEKYMSISVSPNTWTEFYKESTGTHTHNLRENTWYSSDNDANMDYFTLTNGGGVSVDVLISSSDNWTGTGVHWHVSPTGDPGDHTIGLWAGLDSDSDYVILVKPDDPANFLLTALAALAHDHFGLKVFTCTSGGGNASMSGTITLTAVVHT